MEYSICNKIVENFNKITFNLCKIWMFIRRKRLIKIIAVRHADVHNPKKIVHGRKPGYYISNIGKLYAVKLANELHDCYNIMDDVLLVSSPMLHAQQTSQIIYNSLKTKCNVVTCLDENFNEVINQYEGEKLEALVENKWQIYNFPDNSHKFETFEKVCDRTIQGIRNIIMKRECNNIILVTHADVIMAVRCWGLKKKLCNESRLSLQQDGFYPTTCSITHVYVNEFMQPLYCSFIKKPPSISISI